MKTAASPDWTAPRGSVLRLAAIAGLLVLIAYSLTLYVAKDLTVGEALIAGAANAGATVLSGLVAWWIIVRRVVSSGPLIQIAAHLGLCAGFCLISYWVLIVFLGATTGTTGLSFEVRPFPGQATAWQTLENVTVYGMLAMHAYWYAGSTIRPQGPGPTRAEAKPALARYFIRAGDDILPIDVDAIITLTGADDYVEVSTPTGKHLTRMTLAEFESALDPARFHRVHRSRIVNIARIARAEPAGDGRMLLHMENGEMIQTSRAGAKRFRDHVL